MVGLSYGARNVLSYMVQNFRALKGSPIIPLRRSPSVWHNGWVGWGQPIERRFPAPAASFGRQHKIPGRARLAAHIFHIQTFLRFAAF